MNEGTYYYVIAIFLSYFTLSNIIVSAIYRVKDRKRYYYSRLRHSKWKIRTISSVISMSLTVLTTIFLLRSEIEFELIKKSNIDFSGVYVAIVTVFVLCLAYILGSKKGEEFQQGLSPIIRKPSKYSVINEPYTIFSQSYVFPPTGRRIPSRREMLEWRERTKDFASSGAQWTVLYLQYLILIFEFLIVFLIATLLKGVSILPTWEFVKGFGMILTVGFIPYMFCSFIVHKPLIWILESIKDHFFSQNLRSVEWGFFITHSVLFYVVSGITVAAIIRFGN